MVIFLILAFDAGILISMFVSLFLGHFGYIHLPVPIYHPAHVSELKQMLSLLCLKCLKIKKIKVSTSLMFFFFTNYLIGDSHMIVFSNDLD